MRKYETKMVEREQELQVSRTCNRCSAEIKECNYDDRKRAVSAYTATCYPEGDVYNKGWLVTDLCDSCINWLKRVLIDGGVTIEDASDRDYW